MKNEIKKRKLHGISINELTILYYLMPYGFIRGTKGTLKSIGLGNKEIDIFNHELKIGIEYDGFMHTEKKDCDKNKLCEAAGIKLIRIRESYNSILSDGLSQNFYLTDDGLLSSDLDRCLISACKYINSISSLQIDVSKIHCRKDSNKIFRFIDDNFIVDHVGETNIATNGQKMTIVKYLGFRDMDVQFEDGTIVEKTRYDSFLKGVIRNPNLLVGKETVANNGQKMTIIACRTTADIDVKFEDGTIVTHKKYDSFIKGRIKNPNCTNSNWQENRTMIANNGQEMTIIAFRSTTDVDVQFSDGTIVEHRKYDDFLRGKIRNPNYRINETSVHKNGETMRVVAYRESADIDVQFDDGTIVSHTSYSSFLKGTVRKITYDDRKNREGKTNTARNGQKMTVTKYRNSQDVDVKFEDGTIVKHRRFSDFLSGLIGNPNYKKSKEDAA